MCTQILSNYIGDSDTLYEKKVLLLMEYNIGPLYDVLIRNWWKHAHMFTQFAKSNIYFIFVWV